MIQTDDYTVETLFTKLSEAEFKLSNARKLFGNLSTDRRFEIVTICNQEYKISWQSDLINPILIEIHSCICGIGVDLDFCIVDSKRDKILLSLSLNYFIHDIKIFFGYVYVATEFEIIVIDAKEISVIAKYGLPDLFEDIYPEGNKICVKCFENQKIYFPISIV